MIGRFLKLLPGWPPDWRAKDWRAMLALLFSVAGAVALTALEVWLVWILWRGGWADDTQGMRIEALAKALMGTLFIVGVILVTLGFAINKREISGKLGTAEFRAGGGEDDGTGPPKATRTVTTTGSVEETVTTPAQ